MVREEGRLDYKGLRFSVEPDIKYTHDYILFSALCSLVVFYVHSDE